MKKLCLIVCCSIFTAFSLKAETLSLEQILLLNLSDSGYNLSTESNNVYYSQIVSAFTRFGKYQLKSTTYSVNGENIQTLINKIRNDNGQGLSKRESEIFSGSSLIVVPVIEDYKTNTVDSMFESEIYLSLYLVRLNTNEEIDKLLLHTYGVGESSIEADEEAATEMGKQLFYNLGLLEGFRFDTYVVEVIGNDVIIESSASDNISVGDEFYISGALSSDKEKNKDKAGLIIISSKRGNALIGHIIYSDFPVTSGCGLIKKSSFGIELLPYGRIFIDEAGVTTGSGGLKVILSKWVYHVRPTLSLEVPFSLKDIANNWTGFPLSIMAGTELLWNINRFWVEPNVGIGITGLLPTNENESFQFSHIGFSAGVTLQWLFFDFFKVFLESGYNKWLNISENNNSAINDYGGIYIGTGVTFKN